MMYTLGAVNLGSVGALRLKIDMNYDNRRVMPFAVQMMISRILLYEFKNVCVCPVQELSHIILIGEQRCLAEPSKQFLDFLQKQRIKIADSIQVDAELVERALRFSLFYWMEAKLWCRVGECLMLHHFLSLNNSSLQYRVEPHLNVASDGEIMMSPRCVLVRVIPFELWQLDEEGRPPKEGFVPARNVTVLPRLGRGRVAAFYRSLPSHSPFSNYAELRAYWKNTYGYELPFAEPPAYLDVFFYGMRESFCYPSYCVLSGAPEEVPYRREDEMTRNALARFINDLANCGIEIVGQKLQVKEATKSVRFDLTMALLDFSPVHPNKFKKSTTLLKFGFKQKQLKMTSNERYLSSTSQQLHQEDEIDTEKVEDRDSAMLSRATALGLSQFSQQRHPDYNYAEVSRNVQLGAAFPSSYSTSFGFGAGSLPNPVPKLKPIFISRKLAGSRTFGQFREESSDSPVASQSSRIKPLFLYHTSLLQSNTPTASGYFTPEKRQDCLPNRRQRNLASVLLLRVTSQRWW